MGSGPPPVLKILLVGHFLEADLARCFGKTFYHDIFTAEPDDPRPLTMRDGRPIRLAYAGGSPFSGPPIVEYVTATNEMTFGISLQTRDTSQVYGKGSLDDLSQTFLGRPKSGSLDASDKACMLETFRQKPIAAYSYAMIDAVHTLLVHERMTAEDRQIHTEFGVEESQIPAMRATLGSRVAQFTIHMTQRHAADSSTLQGTRALRTLMRSGNPEGFGGERGLSHFGCQTGQIHGGLIFSRSPDRLWHEAPGMLRDVDMQGCYAAITGGIDAYWGRPVVLEPGGYCMRLTEAVELASRAADPDG